MELGQGGGHEDGFTFFGALNRQQTMKSQKDSESASRKAWWLPQCRHQHATPTHAHSTHLYTPTTTAWSLS